MPSRTDNFNRANETLNGSTPSDGLSPAWSATAGNFWVVSNQAAELNGSLGDPVAFLDCGSADADAQATLAVLPAGGSTGLCGRSSDQTHTIFFLYGASGILQLWKNNGGSYTQLGSTVSYTASAGDVFKLSMSGNTINAYVNGALKIGPITDSFNNTVATHGLYSNNELAARWDDVSITVAGAASGLLARRRRALP